LTSDLSGGGDSPSAHVTGWTNNKGRCGTMFRITKLTVKRIGDKMSNTDDLKTVWDGDKIIESSQYSNADIEELGLETVRQYCKEDEARIKQFEDGDLYSVGVVAEAELIHSKEKDGGGTIHKISTAGVWGIDSDATEDDFREVGEEELEALKDILSDMGIDEEEFGCHSIDWQKEVVWE
jgi:hypothetical protein